MITEKELDNFCEVLRQCNELLDKFNAKLKDTVQNISVLQAAADRMQETVRTPAKKKTAKKKTASKKASVSDQTTADNGSCSTAPQTETPPPQSAPQTVAPPPQSAPQTVAPPPQSTPQTVAPPPQSAPQTVAPPPQSAPQTVAPPPQNAPQDAITDGRLLDEINALVQMKGATGIIPIMQDFGVNDATAISSQVDRREFLNRLRLLPNV